MSIYDNIYNLLNQYVFGGNIIPSTVQDSSCSLIATALCIFVVAIPFVLVWRVIKMLAGG